LPSAKEILPAASLVSPAAIPARTLGSVTEIIG